MSRCWLSVIGVLAAVIGVGGCASGVDIHYPESQASAALLASVTPQRVAIGTVADRRADKTRIGLKPKSKEAIVPRRPVEEIVREALAIEIAKNGHTVVADAGDVVLAANVEEFWLDAVGRQGTTQYVGRVAIALVVIDAQTGGALLTRRYVGIKRRDGEADAESVWREVMEAALARTMRDVATDPELVGALTRAPIRGAAST